ncbi:MAG: hypothetical protein KGI71_05920 [Patescibacteria group bacterium]|nr:hypothetical protein [Patescibacteria group bacterium]
MENTRELMHTAMEHNRKLLNTALDARDRASQIPLASVTQPALSPEHAQRKAVIDNQLQERVKKLQMKYAGKITPQRMQELHAQTTSNINPGAALSPSSGAVLTRALSAGNAPLTSGTLETGAPFMPLINGVRMQ